MSEPNLKVKVDIPSRNGTPKFRYHKSFSLNDALAYIARLPVDDGMKKLLIDKLKTYPDNTYEKFCVNINKNIDNLAKNREKNKIVTTFIEDEEITPNIVIEEGTKANSAGNNEDSKISSRPVRQSITDEDLDSNCIG